MKRRNAALAVGLLSGFWLVASSAPASARSAEDCEKLTDWHAYNTCLASFGPRRGQRAARGQSQAVDPERRGRRSAGAASVTRPASGISVQRIAGGRMRATLDVGAARRR